MTKEQASAFLTLYNWEVDVWGSETRASIGPHIWYRGSRTDGWNYVGKHSVRTDAPYTQSFENLSEEAQEIIIGLLRKLDL